MIANSNNPLKKYEDDINKLFYKKEAALSNFNKKNTFNFKKSKIVLISLVKELKKKMG